VAESAGALEFAKDGFLVLEEVADEAVAVAFVHCQTAFYAWTEDAGSEVMGECGYEGFVCGGEFD